VTVLADPLARDVVIGSGGCDVSLVAVSPFGLTPDEYEAPSFAAGMLDVRAEQFDTAELHWVAKATREQAAVLRGLHDRWHLSRVRTAGLDTDHTDCAWCLNALAVAS